MCCSNCLQSLSDYSNCIPWSCGIAIGCSFEAEPGSEAISLLMYIGAANNSHHAALLKMSAEPCEESLPSDFVTLLLICYRGKKIYANEPKGLD